MKGLKRGLHIRGLRQRWLLQAVLPIVLLVAVGVGIFAINAYRSYLHDMREGLEARALVASENFSSYGMKSYSDYYRYASVTAETFEDKDFIELQFINVSGLVQVSSYGFTAGTSPDTSDVGRALRTGTLDSFVGRDAQTQENILSVSSPLIFNGRVVGVLRYVTSLREMESRLVKDCLAALGVGVLCIVLAIFSNAIFINNVVEPVAVVSHAASRISGGSYGVLVENRYRDELGELVDNVNNMSLKISQTEKMQQEFISSVSHELRTPLTAIGGWAETLYADPDADGEMKRGLGIIIKESRRLTGMVEELLEFNKMQDGRFTLSVETTDMLAELEDAVYTYRELLRQEGIEVRYACDDEIAPFAADPQRMKQVFGNVLDNAAKHGGAGGRVEVCAAAEDGELVITVRDHGPGIPEEELPFVKQKFYKGSSKARGSGIGLAVCEEIVRLHGGSFTVANAEGGGTLVTIRLPMENEKIIEK